jgi:hypothetical protein
MGAQAAACPTKKPIFGTCCLFWKTLDGAQCFHVIRLQMRVYVARLLPDRRLPRHRLAINPLLAVDDDARASSTATVSRDTLT